MRPIRAANSRAICATILGVEEPGYDVEDWQAARERSRARHEADRRRREHRRRRGLLVVGGAGALLVVVVLAAGRGGGGDGKGAGAGTTGKPAGAGAEEPAAELPGGGRTIFPGKRVVAFYGTAGTPVLGTLGRGTPAQAARRLQRQARAYRRPGGRTVLPAFGRIPPVAASAPGAGALSRDRRPLADVERYHRAIRREGGCSSSTCSPAGHASSTRSAATRTCSRSPTSRS